MSMADCASPCARMIALCLSCSAFSTCGQSGQSKKQDRQVKRGPTIGVVRTGGRWRGSSAAQRTATRKSPARQLHRIHQCTHSGQHGLHSGGSRQQQQLALQHSDNLVAAGAHDELGTLRVLLRHLLGLNRARVLAAAGVELGVQCISARRLQGLHILLTCTQACLTTASPLLPTVTAAAQQLSHKLGYAHT